MTELVTRYRFDMRSADEAGEHRHPQIVIMEHFPDAIELEPITIGDCWLFKAERRQGIPEYFIECLLPTGETTDLEHLPVTVSVYPYFVPTGGLQLKIKRQSRKTDTVP